MKKIKIIITSLILLTSLILCQQIIARSGENQINKIEYAELNNIRYGLLSVDNWKMQLSGIVADEIDRLDFSRVHQRELKKTIERQLNVLIDEVNKKVKKSNQGSVKGWFKQTFVDLFVSIDDIKKGIPQYADAMMREMRRPENTGKVRNLLKEKLTLFINQTFDGQDMSQVNRIMLRTNTRDIMSARLKLESDIATNYQFISRASLALIIISIILFLLPAFDKTPLQPYQYISMVASLLIMLVVGVTTPMIDMEAKLSQMRFVLLAHPVHFENQVLYFQTKSVLDVFWLMMFNSSPQMKFVGLLMVTFSIIFPVLKLISSVAYYYNYKNAQKNSWIQFFVLKSGKWSMADVMVVAIFMAYIGFNGIITNQFGKLTTNSKDLVILTTNGTALQPGYYLFLTYALLALFLSVFLTRKPYVSAVDSKNKDDDNLKPTMPMMIITDNPSDSTNHSTHLQ
jgi:hypothetical protein